VERNAHIATSASAVALIAAAMRQLLKDAEMAERPPEKRKDEYRRQASTAELLGTPTCR
jgi:hypothetical protein